jgi:hypothetical protein
MPHTFPNHPWLQGADGREALRRVLSAYSVHNTRIGYCRSMNNIVAVLLVSEEQPLTMLLTVVKSRCCAQPAAHRRPCPTRAAGASPVLGKRYQRSG